MQAKINAEGLEGLESLLKSSHSVAGVPRVVGSGAAEPQEQLSAKSQIK
ncbi:MAG: hypothetical protein V7L14_00615 [Nostoc sp.]